MRALITILVLCAAGSVCAEPKPSVKPSAKPAAPQLQVSVVEPKTIEFAAPEFEIKTREFSTPDLDRKLARHNSKAAPASDAAVMRAPPKLSVPETSEAPATAETSN